MPSSPLVELIPQQDFQHLFESLPGLYMIMNPALKIVAANDSYLKATFTKREDIVGRYVFDVFPDNPNDKSKGSKGSGDLRISLEHVLRERVPDAMAILKYDIRKPDSSEFEPHYWSLTNFPVLDSNGHLKYIINRVEDVTDFVMMKQGQKDVAQANLELRTKIEAKEAEVISRAQQIQNSHRELRAAHEKLEAVYSKLSELDELKTQFFNNVSHELRTPLTLILGPIEKLIEADNLRPPQKTALKIVQRNAQVLLKHVNDLLDVAKLEAGKLKPIYRKTNLTKLIQLVNSYFYSMVADRQMTVELEVPEELWADVDHDMIERVLQNLMSNAFKFMSNGTGKLVVRAKSQGELIRIEVQDNGPGIPEHLQQAVFERFRQVEKSTTRRHEGTGLGLAIAKEFLLLHHGKILVETAKGGGALFIIEIPRLAPEGVQVYPTQDNLEHPLKDVLIDTASVVESSIQEFERQIGRPNVVLVEDNRELLHYLAESLSADFNVFPFSDARVALKALQTQPVDLIVSDIMMPAMSGEDFFHFLRQDRRLKSIPFIFLTAMGDEKAAEKLLQAGAQDFISKPFKISDVRSRLIGQIYLRNQQITQLEKMNKDLQSANRDLDHFAHLTAHDLREPARRLLMLTEIFRKELSNSQEPIETDRLNKMIGLICEQSNHLLQLIGTFQSLMDAEYHEFLARSETSIQGIIDDILKEFSAEVQVNRVEVLIEKQPPVEAYPHLVTSLYRTLVEYALKHGRPGMLLEFTYESQYDVNLFGLKSTSPLVSGLELDLCKKIVARHQGQVVLESKSGISHFKFSLNQPIEKDFASRFTEKPILNEVLIEH